MRFLRSLKSNKLHCKIIKSRGLSTEVSKTRTWKPVIGLEIHAQISSESKLFSGASTQYGMPVNSCVSFFDCGTPGTLPVLNRRCVEAGVLTALALSCQVNEVSFFDRKHYFYADLPLGYQITQHRQPIAVDGELKFNVFTPGVADPYVKASKIKQIQLEQDSGKSLHDDDRGLSLVDLNRAGVPLMELVFEPDLESGEEAVALIKELIIILRRLDTCSCKIEEGALRVDANISIHREDEPLGVRTEVKNIGSIKGAGAAIKYEIARQIKIRESGGEVFNETRSWDAEKKKTVSMREKEERQDYRMMPEPNLPPLRLHVDKNGINRFNLVDVNSLKMLIPKLPEELRENLRSNHGLSRQNSYILINEIKLLEFFEDIMRENEKRNPKIVGNILINEVLEFVNKNKMEVDDLLFSAKQLGELADLLQSESINIGTVKKLLDELSENPAKMPQQIVEEHQWLQINDPEDLRKLCEAVLEANPELVKVYKGGKKKVLNPMMRQIAKESQERANMGKAKKILEDLLK